MLHESGLFVFVTSVKRMSTQSHVLKHYCNWRLGTRENNGSRQKPIPQIKHRREMH